MAWQHGMTSLHDMTWNDIAYCHDMTWHDMTWHDMTCYIESHLEPQKMNGVDCGDFVCIYGICISNGKIPYNIITKCILGTMVDHLLG